MKKIIQKPIAETYCDGCNDLILEETMVVHATWGYFSNKDGAHCNLEFCSNCSDIVWDFMKEQWPKLILESAYE